MRACSYSLAVAWMAVVKLAIVLMS